MALLGSFAAQAVYSNKALFHWLNGPAYVSNVFLRPILQIILFALIGRFAGQPEAIQIYITGIIAYSCPGLLVATLSQMLYNDLQFGTLPSLYASAANRAAAYFTRAGLQYPNGLLVIATSVLTGWLVVGLDLSHTNWPAFIATVLALTASSCTYSLFVGTMCLHTRTWGFVYIIFQGMVMVLTGIIIPVAALPGPLWALAQVLPVTHALEALRASVNGAGLGEVAGLLGTELVIGLAYAVLGLVSFVWFERVVKQRGTLERASV